MAEKLWEPEGGILDTSHIEQENSEITEEIQNWGKRVEMIKNLTKETGYKLAEFCHTTFSLMVTILTKPILCAYLKGAIWPEVQSFLLTIRIWLFAWLELISSEKWKKTAHSIIKYYKNVLVEGNLGKGMGVKVSILTCSYLFKFQDKTKSLVSFSKSLTQRKLYLFVVNFLMEKLLRSAKEVRIHGGKG